MMLSTVIEKGAGGRTWSGGGGKRGKGELCHSHVKCELTDICTEIAEILVWTEGIEG